NPRAGRHGDRGRVSGRGEPRHRPPRRHHGPRAAAYGRGRGPSRGFARPARAAARPRSGGDERGDNRLRVRSVLTTERTLVAGPALRTGPRASYRGVAQGPGEPHVV